MAFSEATPPGKRNKTMLFMVIERFRDRGGAAVYRRFREKGRMLPDGLKYIDSWVEMSRERCFQLMECDDVQLFQQWIARWNDLVDFEIVSVRTSRDAAGTTPVVYSAVKRFDPTCGGEWHDFVEWSGLTQLREVVSLDSTLCPTIVEELTAEDWQHNVQQESKMHLFHDLEYVIGRPAETDRVNLLALIQNPTDGDIRSFDDCRFDFCGFDLMDLGLGNSALVNCGGFPEAFSSADLSDCGLITDHAKALHVQKLLRDKYPDEFHADCDVWAIWRMKSELARCDARRTNE